MKSSATQPKTSDMVLVHKVFRREFVLVPRLVRATAEGDTQRARLVGTHLTDMINALRHHHDAESDLVWPRLAQRAPLAPELAQALAAAHAAHRALIAELDGLLPLWLASAEADIAAVVADIVEELAAGLAAHLDAVERAVLPVVERHFSGAEWLQLGLRAACWIPLTRMAVMLGAMLEDATPDERSGLLARVPAPARMLYRTVGQQQYNREMAALRRTLVAA